MAKKYSANSVQNKRHNPQSGAKAASGELIEKEPIVSGRHAMAFHKANYILLTIGMAIVIIGFLLMVASPSTTQAYNPGIFSALHIKVAPAVCLFGFLFMIFAIIYHKKDQGDKSAAENTGIAAAQQSTVANKDGK